MAITHPTAQRSAFAASVLGTIDGGAGNGNCVLKATSTVVSTIPLNKPSFSESNGVLTLDNTGPPTDSSPVGGTPDNFTFESSTGTGAFNGDIPGDLTLSKATIDPADSVELTSYTYTASP